MQTDMEITMAKAFNGAYGYGATAKGGAGGPTIHVDNPSDANIRGTLRYAINRTGPRKIVFDGPMTIENLTPLTHDNGLTTIDGRTETGKGVTLKGEEFRCRSSDNVYRYLRFRPGDKAPATEGYQNRDAFNLDDPHGVGVARVILDHCSHSWSIDELFSAWGGSHDITLQWCILSEALWHSKHPDGPHSMGPLIGSSKIGKPTYNVSTHHCLLAHCNQRMPQLSYCDNVDFRNNIIYNAGAHCMEIEKPGRKTINIVNNIFLKGPNSAALNGACRIGPDVDDPYIYIAGNYDEYSGISGYFSDDWPILRLDSGEVPPTTLGGKKRKLSRAFLCPYVPTESTSILRMHLLGDVGCSLPRRDLIDERVVASLQARTGRIIDSQDDVGGWDGME